MRALALITVFAAFFMGAWDARAEDAEAPAASTAFLQQSDASHPERVILAWYKIAGKQPEFEKWAALSPFLDNAKDSDIAPIISRETNRLLRAYAEFDVSAPLVVHTNLKLDDYSTINNAISFDEFSVKTFFAYSLYGENIAIVPRDIKNFSTIPLAKDKMDALLAKAGSSSIVAELKLKPVLADAKAPFAHEGRDYSLLLADIAELSLWTNNPANPQLLWTWRADWYAPKADQTLLNLKPQGLL